MIKKETKRKRMQRMTVYAQEMKEKKDQTKVLLYS